jgi:hypothetical protein
MDHIKERGVATEHCESAVETRAKGAYEDEYSIEGTIVDVFFY